MDNDEQKRLQLENKKLTREIKRLNQEITLLRTANEQAVHTQAYIQKETDRQLFFIEQLMKTSQSIVMLTDDQSRTVLTSDLYFRYNYNYDKNAIRRGIPLRDALDGLLPDEELGVFMEKSRAALRGKDVKPYIIYVTRDGVRRSWRASIWPMRRGSEVVGLSIIFVDTTEIVDALERAEAAGKAKSNFLAKMSHEIRTPINAILGLNEVILRDSSEPDTLSNAADIQNAGKTLLSLINDILDFSKVEEGKMEILPTQYELGSIVNDLVNMTRPRAEEKGLDFYIFVDDTTPSLLFGDEIRIRQCALNLLTNAVKYTDAGSVTLTIGYTEVSTEKIRLNITVSDTGYGIKPEDMERLSSPFARLEESRNRTVEGTGLGLAITKQLLDLMGSSLQVESIYGEGSEFSFSIEQPVVKWWPIGEFGGRYETGRSNIGPGHELFCAPEAQILVVDDVELNLTVVKGLLKKTQVQIDTATSGRQAISKFSKNRYDVALIDHMMPDMDGIETMHELKQLPGAEDTVFIALTANAISGSREKYLSEGFQDYLSKPVDVGKLEEMLLKYLPPTKVTMLEAPDEGVCGYGDEEAAPTLPDWLGDISGLDVELGLKKCASVETYIKTLEVYARTAASNAQEIDHYLRSGDIGNVITKVHALKSTSRIIGAEALGDFAEKLELAGKAGDMDTLFGGLDELLSRTRALGKSLSPLLHSNDGWDEALPQISDDQLQDSYKSIRRLLSEFEYSTAADLIEQLLACRLSGSERERLEKMRLAAESFDWDDIADMLPQ
ncbi:MAG: response regulator [Oscillospiraceae bacterium]|nr:response regulator [Oscillospiraceae bacterium]